MAKSERLESKENPRCVVASPVVEEWPVQRLYEELYCGHGEVENRIKEKFRLFADRASAETMRTKQFRI